MKTLFTSLAILMLLASNLQAQEWTYFYNPYAGMNEAQLNLALEQAERSKRNGIIATTVGTGIMVAGAIITVDGFQTLTLDGPDNFGTFAAGLGLLTLGTFPATFGLFGWLTGNERINRIQIELLAFDTGNLDLKPTENGLGMVLTF